MSQPLKPFFASFIFEPEQDGAEPKPGAALVYEASKIKAQQLAAAQEDVAKVIQVSPLSRPSVALIPVILPDSVKASDLATYVIAPGLTKKRAGRPPTRQQRDDD